MPSPRERPSDRLRRLMAERNWSQRHLATLAGMRSASSVSNVLAQLEVRPDGIELRTARRLASAFGLTVADLFSEVAEKALAMQHELHALAPPGPPSSFTDPHPASSAPPPAAARVEVADAGGDDAGDANDLRHALALAFDGRRHSLDDLRALDDLLRPSKVRMALFEGDVVAAAGRWLDAVRRLRLHGEAISLASLLLVLTAGSAEQTTGRIEALRELAPAAKTPSEELEPPSAPIGPERRRTR